MNKTWPIYVPPQYLDVNQWAGGGASKKPPKNMKLALSSL